MVFQIYSDVDKIENMVEHYGSDRRKMLKPFIPLLKNKINRMTSVHNIVIEQLDRNIEIIRLTSLRLVTLLEELDSKKSGKEELEYVATIRKEVFDCVISIKNAEKRFWSGMTNLQGYLDRKED